MKNLKDFKKFVISQKVASVISGGNVPPFDDDDNPGGGGGGNGGSSGLTVYCCRSCDSGICGTNAKSVQLQCLNTGSSRIVPCS